MHVDLNLLASLNALLEEGSVAGAAKRMHLSQPAMSRTLGRLRTATGDQLLVRVGHRMELTNYAHSVREQVNLLVRQGKEVLEPKRQLVLSSLNRVLAISGNELVLAAMGGRLVREFQERAPGVKLKLLAEPPTESTDVQQGRVDFAINGGLGAAPDLCRTVIHLDRLVAVVDQDHALAKGKVNAEAFARSEHVIVSRRGQLRDMIDNKLEELRLRRKVVAAVPSTAAALTMVRDFGCVAVVPEAMCTVLLGRSAFRLIALPVQVEPIPLLLTWHRRNDGDPVSLWAREEIAKSFRALLAP